MRYLFGFARHATEFSLGCSHDAKGKPFRLYLRDFDRAHHWPQRRRRHFGRRRSKCRNSIMLRVLFKLIVDAQIYSLI